MVARGIQTITANRIVYLEGNLQAFFSPILLRPNGLLIRGCDLREVPSHYCRNSTSISFRTCSHIPYAASEESGSVNSKPEPE